MSVLGTEGHVFKSHFPVKVIIFNSLKNKNFIKMNTKILLSKNTERHPFHMVDPSPWPLLSSLGALASTFGGVMFMHVYSGGRT